MTEVRTVSSTGGEKGTKDERFDLLPPGPLAAVARHYAVGAKKYAAHNWRRGYSWSNSYAALQRHANAFWNGEDIDEETGSPHMAAVVFHALALLQFMEDHRDFDDRYSAERTTFPPSSIAEQIEQLQSQVSSPKSGPASYPEPCLLEGCNCHLRAGDPDFEDDPDVVVPGEY